MARFDQRAHTSVEGINKYVGQIRVEGNEYALTLSSRTSRRNRTEAWNKKLEHYKNMTKMGLGYGPYDEQAEKNYEAVRQVIQAPEVRNDSSLQPRLCVSLSKFLLRGTYLLLLQWRQSHSIENV